jgi:hypothetical protein
LANNQQSFDIYNNLNKGDKMNDSIEKKPRSINRNQIIHTSLPRSNQNRQINAALKTLLQEIRAKSKNQNQLECIDKYCGKQKKMANV